MDGDYRHDWAEEADEEPPEQACEGCGIWYPIDAMRWDFDLWLCPECWAAMPRGPGVS